MHVNTFFSITEYWIVMDTSWQQRNFKSKHPDEDHVHYLLEFAFRNSNANFFCLQNWRKCFGIPMEHQMITLASILIHYSDKVGRLYSHHTLSFRQTIELGIHESYIIFLLWSRSDSLLLLLLLLLHRAEAEGCFWHWCTLRFRLIHWFPSPCVKRR